MRFMFHLSTNVMCHLSMSCKNSTTSIEIILICYPNLRRAQSSHKFTATLYLFVGDMADANVCDTKYLNKPSPISYQLKEK